MSGGNPAPGFRRQPDRRMDYSPAGRRVRVVVDGVTVADSVNAIALAEADHPLVYYFPQSDTQMDLAHRTSHSTHCPFKGDASYWSLRSTAVASRMSSGLMRHRSTTQWRSRAMSPSMPIVSIRWLLTDREGGLAGSPGATTDGDRLRRSSSNSTVKAMLAERTGLREISVSAARRISDATIRSGSAMALRRPAAFWHPPFRRRLGHWDLSGDTDVLPADCVLNAGFWRQRPRTGNPGGSWRRRRQASDIRQ